MEKLTSKILDKTGFNKIIGTYRLRITKEHEDFLIEINPHDNDSYFIINIDHKTNEIYQGGLVDFKFYYVDELELIFKLFGVNKEVNYC